MSINNLYGKCKAKKKFQQFEDVSEDLKDGELEDLTDYQPKNLIYKLYKIKMKVLEMKFIKEKCKSPQNK